MRRGALSLLTAVLVLALVAFGVFLAFTRSLTSNQTKVALAGSGAYEAVAPGILQEYESEQIAGVSVSDPAVQKAAAQAFSSSYVQQKINPAIDATFSWLAGNTPKPAFTIDYAEGKQAFIKQLSQDAVQRSASLPDCSLQELFALRGTDIASFTPDELTCLPPGVTKAQIQSLVTAYLAHAPDQPEILQKTSYKASEVTISGQPFYKNASVLKLQQGYRLLGKAPWISAAAALVLIGIIFWLGRDRRKLFLRVAVSLIIAGLIASFAALSLKPIAHRELTHLANAGTSYELLRQKAADAGTLLASYSAHELRIIGAVMVVGGAALLVVLQWRTLRRLNK